MSWLRRLANAFKRTRVDQAIDEELQFHVEMRAADLERRCMSGPQARRQAERSRLSAGEHESR